MASAKKSLHRLIWIVVSILVIVSLVVTMIAPVAYY